jgi:hypothetical protein
MEFDLRGPPKGDAGRVEVTWSCEPKNLFESPQRFQPQTGVRAIGTGFVVDVQGTNVVGCSAAPVFAEVRSLQRDLSRIGPPRQRAAGVSAPTEGGRAGIAGPSRCGRVSD